MKNSKLTDSKLFKLPLLVVGTTLFLLSIAFPDSVFALVLLELLLALMLGTFAIDRLKEKRWLASSAYLIVGILNILIAVQMLLRLLSH
ncbi:hypothetical protein R078131_00649 [Convivina intestini]|nr:hypothetical protein R078131_00649 [Convivina intestini]